MKMVMEITLLWSRIERPFPIQLMRMTRIIQLMKLDWEARLETWRAAKSCSSDRRFFLCFRDLRFRNLDFHVSQISALGYHGASHLATFHLQQNFSSLFILFNRAFLILIVYWLAVAASLSTHLPSAAAPTPASHACWCSLHFA